MSNSPEQLFTKICNTQSLSEIQTLFSELCSALGIEGNHYEAFYPALKASRFSHWKAKSLFQLLDSRASLPEYNGGRACAGRRVLVVGGGPVGLRGAIELAMLGARVDLVEKRTEFTRNNCLHLWQFAIADLKSIGAKVLYSRFAYGTIEHISTKFLQAILLRICLILGVKVHSGVAFESIVEPDDTHGWRVMTSPSIDPLSSYDFDLILGADGNKHTLSGFKSRVFRPKLALGITINFVNRNTSKECAVKELGGLSVMSLHSTFADLATKHGIQLENITYFKDETHYFVMTALKTSLLQTGVIKKDSKDVRELLKKSNVSKEKLAEFATLAATQSSGLPDPEVVINHRGEKDVDLFDFTTMHEAENASRIIERRGKKLLLCIAGDTLIMPFWPSGTGCNRGFLGAFDAAWMFKGFCAEDADMISLLEERESILTLLSQVHPFSLQTTITQYTIDPMTRYSPITLRAVKPRRDVHTLYDSDTLSRSNQETEETVDEVGVTHDSSQSSDDDSIDSPIELPAAH